MTISTCAGTPTMERFEGEIELEAIFDVFWRAVGQ